VVICKEQGFRPFLRGMYTAVALTHDGHRFHLGNLRVLQSRDRLCLGVHSFMTPWELVLGSIMALGLTVYLVYAMLRPERF
jgi:K+-transporting ATPase KdpF subunit